MGYQCAEYGPFDYCSSVASGDRRRRLTEEEEEEEEEEETVEKTKHQNQKIYAGLHSGIDNLLREYL